MDKDIKISIAIPCYGMHGKGAEYLDFNLEKIYNQTHKNVEVSISDHSIDNLILNTIKKWKKKLNIKYNRNKYNIGSSSANINNAIKNCSGELIKILFQDDFLYDNESLTKTIKSFDFNGWWLVSTCCHTNNGIDFYRTHIPSWNEFIHRGINTISSPSVVTIKNGCDVEFDINLIWLMDVDYYKKLFIKYGNPIILDDITVVNRMWENQVSNVLTDDIKNKEVVILTKKYETN